MSPTLTVAIGAYPHTAALRDGQVGDARVRPAFAEVKPINRAFAPMVREGRFDLSEMAIATLLQAKAHGKPLVLLPVVLAARFQEAALLTLRDGPVAGPADLAGKRVGVRAYSQTTGLWLRGTLAEAHGVAPEAVDWLTFEDAHVAEVRDPPFARRAEPGADMMAMLRTGELDAVVVGNDVPGDPDLTTVFPDPDAAGAAFRQRHGFMPVNHLLTVRRDVLEGRREAVEAFVDLVAASAERAPPRGYAVATTRAALEPAIALALRYADEQGLLPRPMSVDEVWA
jgi:4,5-dihydroxyphthalate decarboxylase